MIIQFLLISGLVACIAYVLVQRHRSRSLSVLIIATASLGIVFVLFPELSNKAAGRVGVGRGADLVLYCWMLISFALIINLQVKLIFLNSRITELVRHSALGTPSYPSVESNQSNND